MTQLITERQVFGRRCSNCFTVQSSTMQRFSAGSDHCNRFKFQRISGSTKQLWKWTRTELTLQPLHRAARNSLTSLKEKELALYDICKKIFPGASSAVTSRCYSSSLHSLWLQSRAALPSKRMRMRFSLTYPQLRHTEEHVKYSSGKKELWAIWSSGISPLNRSLRACQTEKNELVRDWEQCRYFMKAFASKSIGSSTGESQRKYTANK